MTAPAAIGGGLGAILGAVLANILKKYAGYDITLTDAAAIVAAMIAATGAVFHAIVSIGILGVWSVFLHGRPKIVAKTEVLVPPPE